MQEKALVFTAFTLPHELRSVEDTDKQEGIRKYCLSSIENYAKCESVGLVYLFIPEGYQALLGDTRPWEGLERERLLRQMLERAIRVTGATKVQIVGTAELTATMAQFSRRAADLGRERLGNLLLGYGQHLYYDSPKVVEAIIRLARTAKNGNEPIFRFDADVEVDDDNVRTLLEYYSARCDDEFCFFSGGYRARDLDPETACELGPELADPEVQRLFNGYAVRVAQFCDKAGCLDKGKAHRFLKDLPKIGADPEEQVISGAGLYISPEAIRTLPPFANVGELIIWIDDHLKRILHEDLVHFGYPKNAHRRCKEATFVQDRYPPPDGVTSQAIQWHATDYLRRLVRGCLLDALIQDRTPHGQGAVAGHVETFIKRRLKLMDYDLHSELEAPARNHLEQIISTWAAPGYVGSAVYDLAEELAAALSRQGSDIPCIREAIAAIDSYFELLGIWKEFVDLCERRIDRRLKANRWLFRDPV
ncbi:MAG: hypothetical protein WBF66_04730 [Dehalococcoidia bacterium]